MRPGMPFLILTLACFLCLSAPALAETNEPFTLDGTRLIIHEGVERITSDDPDLFNVRLMYVTELVLPSSLRVIDDYEVLYALGCKAIVIPEGVERIGEGCFSNAAAASVWLPSTLREVCAKSFTECVNVAELTVSDRNPYYKTADNVLFSKDGSTLVYYPAGKRDAHYDVPAGVTAIADWAFADNHYLETLSLPVGLTRIGKWALINCGRLSAVSLPLTLREADDYAFMNCVSLERIALRDTIKAGKEIFYNCPLVKGYDQWKAAEELVAYESYTYEDFRSHQEAYAILSPESARGFATVYAMPSEFSRTLGSFACGSTVKLLGQKDGWCHISFYQDTSEAAAEGYVRESEVSAARLGETLFKIASVRPRSPSVTFYNGGVVVLPLAYEGNALPPECSLSYQGMEGQWCHASVLSMMVEDGMQSLEENYYCFFRPSDLIYTRQYTGDQRTLGMVMSADPRDRLNMRDKPDKSGQSLGKYFSGTQVEILGEEGDWYRVRVDFTEGYMMKKFVEIVPQEQP